MSILMWGMLLFVRVDRDGLIMELLVNRLMLLFLGRPFCMSPLFWHKRTSVDVDRARPTDLSGTDSFVMFASGLKVFQNKTWMGKVNRHLNWS